MKPIDSVDLEAVTGGNFESYAMIFLRALADTIGVASGRGYSGYGYNNYAYNNDGNYGYANNGYVPYQDPRYAGYGYQYGYRQGYGNDPRTQMQMQMQA